jgi:hypothetical protein
VKGREVAGCDRLRYRLCKCAAGFRLMASDLVPIIMALDIELTDTFDFAKLQIFYWKWVIWRIFIPNSY